MRSSRWSRSWPGRTAHHAAHGHWPVVGVLSGPVDGVPGESWKAINHALALGLRGLPGDSSLAELLAEQRAPPARHGAAGAWAQRTTPPRSLAHLPMRPDPWYT